jgi:1-acyl-sn-glycerol-3-phosphate acyltransferase
MGSGHTSDSAFWAPAFGSMLFEGFCRAFFRWYCPLQVEGRHYLPDEPFLLCSNHSSHADSAVLMTASGRSFRHFALVGASDYFFHSRRIRWSVSPLMNVIPIDRQPGPKSLATCLTTCRRFLQDAGGTLILYPEGTRSPDGKMQPFKSGVALFALELGVPVVPAYIDGTYRILPKGQSIPRSAPVTVRFGDALSLAGTGSARTSGGLPRDRRRQVVEQLTRSIQMLRPGYKARELAVSARQHG